MVTKKVSIAQRLVVKKINKWMTKNAYSRRRFVQERHDAWKALEWMAHIYCTLMTTCRRCYSMVVVLADGELKSRRLPEKTQAAYCIYGLLSCLRKSATVLPSTDRRPLHDDDTTNDHRRRWNSIVRRPSVDQENDSTYSAPNNQVPHSKVPR